MNIISQQNYLDIIDDNKHHFDALEEIVRKSGEPMEGNCVYVHGTFLRAFELIPKQRNLFSIASAGNRVLEIGFNAGHSALLFLIANKDCVITCFDICNHKYTRPCFQYINENFKNRLSLFAGSSVDTVSRYIRTHPFDTFDIFHIDGSHDGRVANLDFHHCQSLAHNCSIAIWDDSWMPELAYLWSGYIRDNKITPFNMLNTPMYEHSLGYFIKKE